MKVLFLDIDGVCNNATTKERFLGFVGINPKMAEQVKRIVKETGCSVVLSSTWRKDKEFREEVRDKVVDFIGVTPVLASGFRGDEVNKWLRQHIGVKHYAILDDDSDFHPDQPHFKTSYVGKGLTKEIADKVIEYLNKEQHEATS